MAELEVLNNTPVASDGITMTGNAVQQVLKLRQESNIADSQGLRIGVKGGGCSGFTYVLAFDEGPKETDKVLDVDGVRVFIDQKSLFYLAGTVLDYSDGLNGKGFVFTNPQAAKTCGCGNSFGV